MAAKPITIQFLGPTDLTGYNRWLRPDQQPANIPETYLDALSVRHEVFVKGQGVPLSLEADADDIRSCHWVAYASPTDHPTLTPIPVGTIRLVPFPHDPHPLPGSAHYEVDDTEHRDGVPLAAESPPFIVDRETTLCDGKEPYYKFGRLAVLESFRGSGIADLLVKSAIQWAKENPEFFNVNGVIFGAEGEELSSHRKNWNGLICVHAQEYVAKAWGKWGFVADEVMGKWTEAKIPHVGMFLRLEVLSSTDEKV